MGWQALGSLHLAGAVDRAHGQRVQAGRQLQA
jgi:hypothetical protein